MSDEFPFAPGDDSISLSLVVPIYNSARYIPRIADTLRKQVTTYPFEVLLVDDGSTDETARLVVQHCADIPNVKLLQQKNGGVSAARNTGIEAARGKYIAFMDHDDAMMSTFIQRMVEVAEDTGASCVKCLYQEVEEDGGTLGRVLPSSGFVWGGVYLRSLFQRVRFPMGFWYEDMINPFLLASQHGMPHMVHEVLFAHSLLSGSASQSLWNASSPQCLEQLYLAEGLLRESKQLGIDDTYLFVCVLHECSSLMVDRTAGLKRELREQVFLASRELVLRSLPHTKPALSKRDALFLRAFEERDYTAWELAALL